MKEETLICILEGMKCISYADWVKLRTAIDRSFDMKASEMKCSLQLARPEEIIQLIRSQFG